MEQVAKLLPYAVVSAASLVALHGALRVAGRLVGGIGRPTRRADQVRQLFLTVIASALFLPPQTLTISYDDAPCRCFDEIIPHVPLPILCADLSPGSEDYPLSGIGIEWTLHFVILGCLVAMAFGLTFWLGRPGPEGVRFGDDSIRVFPY